MADFKKIEQKWQKKWESSKIFNVKEGKKKKLYVLEMFPYPSGSGLHMGHAFNYTIGDIYARFKRMQGFNVLYPMGYDSFGLPAENAAIKEKTHPRKYTETAINNFISQQKQLGLSYDWSRLVITSNPEYYRWNQYFFLKLFEKDLIYRKKAPVNFCPKCDTVLANEQVHNGKCWRHTDTDVETKQLEQWFLKTTDYAEELLECIDELQWPERIKIMQKNWIGRKEWIDINYEIANTNKRLTVSTTRPDTNFGATFIVIAPEHPILSKEGGLVKKEYRKAVDDYIKYAKKKTEEERIEEGKKKTGVFTGLYCINQLTKKKMPIWVTDFVLMSVGTGAVVGVPGHDKRDFEFAKEFNLPVIRVVVGSDGEKSEITKIEQVQEESGLMINSEFLNGLDIHAATKKIMDYIEKKGWGRRVIRYRLRDWLISRQRYWGTPIPIVYCSKCGIVPVPEKDLPVLLPENVRFGKGNPLESSKSFVETFCPRCKSKARRETDTMDTFFDSSWYYLRYCDNKNKKKPFDKSKVDYWLPVDQYIGGAEHACMHLIYARFFTKALRDLGFLNFDEPFIKLFNQGMLHKDGFVMSKSRGNVVLPEEISKKYGIDTARLYLVSIASPDRDIEWSDQGIEGSSKFINKIFEYFGNVKLGKSNARIKSKLHKAIKEVTNDLDNFNYNLVVIKLRTLFNSFEEEIDKKDLNSFIKLLAPICPHISEELWNKLGNEGFISLAKWPECDESLIDERLESLDLLIENVKSDINTVLRLAKIEKPSKINLFIAREKFYKNKEDYELELKALKENINNFEKIFNCNVELSKAEDSKDAKANKAKVGKPAILIE